MKSFFLSVMLMLGCIQFAYADCDDAFKKCHVECQAVKSFFNFQTGKFVKSTDTDFPVNCENSCSRGRRYCESESNRSESCYEFKRACRNDCPTALFNYRGGNYLFTTDVNAKCEDACSYGYRKCE